jgi:hypothetical protein
MRTRLAALSILCPAIALAGGLRLAAELPDVKYSSIVKLSAQRFGRVGVAWDRYENGQAKMPRYALFDFQERKVIEVPIPLHELPKPHTDVLRISTTRSR